MCYIQDTSISDKRLSPVLSTFIILSTSPSNIAPLVPESAQARLSHSVMKYHNRYLLYRNMIRLRRGVIILYINTRKY